MSTVARAGYRFTPTLAGVLLTAYLLEHRTAPGGAGRLIIVAALTIGFATWALLDLDSFLLVAVLGAFIYPTPLLTQGGAIVALADVLLVLAGVMWVARIAARAERPLWLRGNPMIAAFITFMIVTGLSLIWSVNRGATVRDTLQLAEIVLVIPLLYASVPRSLEGILRGMRAYVWVTAGLSVVLFAYFLSSVGHGAFHGVYLPGLHKNASGAFTASGFVLAVTLWLGQHELGRLRFARSLVVIEFAGLAATASRGAVLGSFVGSLAAAAMLRRGRKKTIALIVAAAAAIFFGLRSSLDLGTTSSPHSSTSIRFEAWHAAFHTIATHPLDGVGAGAWFAYLPKAGVGLKDPTNMFLLTWAELGVLGMFALLYLLYRYGLVLRRVTRLSGPGRVLGVAAGAAALSRLVHFQFDITWTRGTTSLCFAFIGVACAVLRLESPAADSADDGARDPASRVPAGTRVIQVVTSRGFAGIERHVLGLARGLQERGLDCAIACPPGAERLRREAAQAGIPLVPREGGSARAWLPELVRTVILSRPEILHVHDGVGALALSHVSAVRGTRLVRTQHFVEPASAARRGLAGRASRSAQRRANVHLAACIAVSQGVAEAAESRGELGAERLVVIPPGVAMPPENAVRQARSRRLELVEPVVCYLGRLEPEKRVDLFVDSIPRILRRLPDCRFVIAGSGSAEPTLRARAAALGVEDSIEWRGWVDGAAAVLEDVHVLANPCPVEGFGLAPLEAMAWGLPVVAVSSSGAREMVDDGRTGLLAGASPNSFADAIARLAADRALARRLGMEARRVVAERFSLEGMLAAVERVYARAL